MPVNPEIAYPIIEKLKEEKISWYGFKNHKTRGYYLDLSAPEYLIFGIGENAERARDIITELGYHIVLAICEDTQIGWNPFRVIRIWFFEKE